MIHKIYQKARDQAIKTLGYNTIYKYYYGVLQHPLYVKYALPPPLMSSWAAIELTNICNLRCSFCHHQKKNYARKKGFIDFELFKKVIDQLSDYGIDNLTFNGGGESLMHPNFIDCIRYLCSKKKWRNIRLNTNGMLWTRDLIKEFLQYYDYQLSFSVQGFKNLDEDYRVGIDHDKVVENINIFLEERKNSKKKPVIDIFYVSKPQEDYKKFVDYWLDKVDLFTSALCFSENSEGGNAQKIEGYNEERKICQIPWNNFWITWNGDVYICEHFLLHPHNGDSVIGNVKEQTIKDIWGGEKIKNIRLGLTQAKPGKTLCNTCERWKIGCVSKPKETLENNVKKIEYGTMTQYYKPFARQKLLNET